MSKSASKEEKNSYHGIYGRTYVGIIMIVVGTIFLLGNFGIIPKESFGLFWPVFIIIPGVFMVLNKRK